MHPGRNPAPLDRPAPATAEQWERVSELIAGYIGLHFPEDRLRDLQQGLARAAAELGFDDADACARWLLSSQPDRRHIDVLASHLTIGETYFFRDPFVFEALSTEVVPRLTGARRGRDQRLRLWSAACSSGEEAYSLAILLHEALPDLRQWQVTLLATDINTRILQRAVSGVFGEWSFRGVTTGIKGRYFQRTADRRYALREEIRRLVKFERLNLVDDVYPSLATDTNAMDIILCRNVLMYLTVAQRRKAVRKLRDALVSGGWLIVSPSETSQELFADFSTVNFPGAILYQKTAAGHRAVSGAVGSPSSDTRTRAPLPPAPHRASPDPASGHAASVRTHAAFEQTAAAQAGPAPPSSALSLYEQGRYAEAVDALIEGDPATTGRDRLSLLVRASANQGRLSDALSWCDEWIAAHRLDAAAYYLRAMVLTERGQVEEARRSLQQATYLEPEFALAHFALGTLAHSSGRDDEAQRHFANTLRILARLRPDEVLPESDGLTAEQLRGTVSALSGHG